jgi:predicted hydrocarbon binding protein
MFRVARKNKREKDPEIHYNFEAMMKRVGRTFGKVFHEILRCPLNVQETQCA